MWQQLSRGIDWLLGLLKGLALVLIAFTGVAVVIEVVLLYFFNHPVDWVTEVTEYSLVYITFLSAAWLLKENGHVKVDFVVKRFRPGVQLVFDLIASLIGLAVSVVITVFGFAEIGDLHRQGVHTETILSLPKAALYSVIPLGSLLLACEFARSCLRLGAQLRRRDPAMAQNNSADL